MEPFPGAPQGVQGQPVYQAVSKPNVVPQVQQPVQSNPSLPNAIATGYQYAPTSNIIRCPTVNHKAFLLQGSDSSNKVLLCLRNPGCTNSTLSLNLVQENNQSDQLQNFQLAGQGSSDTNMGAGAEKILNNPNPANPATDGKPENSHDDLNTETDEKVGSLQIHLSESFLPWNITNKTVLDLEFMRHLLNISDIDVVLKDPKQNKTAIRTAVMQLLQSKVLCDWLVLKCEEKEIPFLKMTSQIEIYSASDFTALLNVVSQETCLPLPFITEENNYIKYLYLNFPKTATNRVRKLNLPIFYVAENGVMKLPCKYPGIRMDCDFENAVDSFTIHVHESAFLVYKTYIYEIRQHLTYGHIVWGFLQMWIRLVKEHYNRCFKFEDIAKSISLCRTKFSMNGKTHGSDNGLIYDIGYLNCYLKFDPAALRETKASFSLENFSTNTVCNLSVVQYYKQYFLINDIQYSETLKNTVHFFRNCNVKNIVNSGNFSSVLPSFRSFCFLSQQVQNVVYLDSTKKNVTNPNLPASASGVPASQPIAVENDKNGVIQVEPKPTSTLPARAKPILKTRTVEEINSSIDAIINGDFNISNFVDDSDTEVSDLEDAANSADEHRLNYKSFVSLIQEFIENCRMLDEAGIVPRDNSVEGRGIEGGFDEAVNKAMKEEALESFIGKIFYYLRDYYSDQVCEDILKKMVWRALEARNPHVKERVSKAVLKLVHNSLVNGVNFGGKYIPLSEWVLDEELDWPLRKDYEDNHPKDTATLPLQSESSTSDSAGDMHYSQEKLSTVSEERDVSPGRSHSPDVIPKKVNKRKSFIPLKRKDRNDNNKRRSTSPVSKSRSKKDKKEDKKQDKKRRSEKDGKDVPYRNTLTFVRVSNSPDTFRIRTKSRLNSSTQSSEAEESESYDVPENFMLEDPNELPDSEVPDPEVQDSEVPVTNRRPQEEEKSVQTDQTPDEEEKSIQTDVTTEEEEKYVQTDVELEEQEKSVQTDQPPEERDRSVQTEDIVEEVDKECPQEKEYSEYNLKVCSVVLNPTEIQTYMGKGKKRKRARTSLGESDVELARAPRRPRKKRYRRDSDDYYFPGERKRHKKEVSEIQYMEARTRVLQRLRKRTSLYGGYESTRISGEELDSFFVKGSPLYKLNSDEDDEEGEKQEHEHEKKQEREHENEQEHEHENEEEIEFEFEFENEEELEIEFENEEELELEPENRQEHEPENKQEHEPQPEIEEESEEEFEEDKDSDTNESYWEEVKKAHGIKELMVLVTRLEDSREYEEYCMRLLRLDGWNPAVDYLTREDFPFNKALQKKYFEFREGKSYLKKNYQVVDGLIVPIDPELIPVTPKLEPESPVREIDFDLDCVKTEEE